ncbi:MAG: class I SAM-dependent rRNA methyltransferase [Pseudomonadota bacterium]|nr:class I SAM-dependent rRNA methyltransferase [Pseudomonadota bacterium]
MEVILKPDRQRSLERRHPWIFSGAVAKINGEPGAGETVTIKSSDGKFLAYAGWSPTSQIVARVWSFDEADRIDATFLRERLRASIARRTALLQSGETNAVRLVHAESDGLPGLIVDQYADVLVVQLLTAGAERWRDELVTGLCELTSCAAIFERSDAEVRELEGFPPRIGALFGAAPSEPVRIHEHGVDYLVDVVLGQKTGFYLDQRDNRRRVMDLAKNKKVLNAFCYTGGFSIGALRAGARSMLSIDSSESALVLAQQNLALNGFSEDQATWWEGDVFQALRTLRDKAEQFDLIVLDPPKFAPTASHAEKASRAYKDINLLALKLLASEGLLVTFSCSGGVNADLFQKIVAGAAVDAKVNAQIIARLGASADHPVSVHFPEGEYLKGLILKKL